MHGLICLGREGTACTKVVLQSRVRIRRWYDVGYPVFLPGRWWCRTWSFLLFSDFCSSACGRVSPFGSLAFLDSFVAGLLRRSHLVAPRGAPSWFWLSSCTSSCSWLGSASSLLAEDFCRSWALVSSSTWSSSISSSSLYFGRFCGIFRVAGCPLGGEICGMYF